LKTEAVGALEVQCFAVQAT